MVRAHARRQVRPLSLVPALDGTDRRAARTGGSRSPRRSSPPTSCSRRCRTCPRGSSSTPRSSRAGSRRSCRSWRRRTSSWPSSRPAVTARKRTRRSGYAFSHSYTSSYFCPAFLPFAVCHDQRGAEEILVYRSSRTRRRIRSSRKALRTTSSTASGAIRTSTQSRASSTSSSTRRASSVALPNKWTSSWRSASHPRSRTRSCSRAFRLAARRS